MTSGGGLPSINVADNNHIEMCLVFLHGVLWIRLLLLVIDRYIGSNEKEYISGGKLFYHIY